MNKPPGKLLSNFMLVQYCNGESNCWPYPGLREGTRTKVSSRCVQPATKLPIKLVNAVLVKQIIVYNGIHFDRQRFVARCTGPYAI